MKLLLTGFEPFGGSSTNPSEQVIRRLAGAQIGGCRISSVLLPVDRFRGPEKLLHSLHHQNPDAVLCLGEASGSMVVSIERVAVNLLDFRIPDNTGSQVVDEPVIPGGPSAYFTTLPVRQIFQVLQTAGIPAQLSLSAGSYLCNQVMYCLLHSISGSERQIPAGFVHLPALPEQAAQQAKPAPSMSLETSLVAVRTIIRCIAQALPE